MLAADAELVFLARLEAGNEKLPDAAGGVQLQRMAAAVPVVEVADDADAPGVRRPDGEVRAADAIDLADLGPELLVTAEQLPFAEQVQVEIGQRRGKAYGSCNVFIWPSWSATRS